MDNSNWFESAFGNDYLTRYAHRNDALATVEVDFLMSELGLNPSQSILDLCCGAGRHLMQLRDRGCQVTGLDLSWDLLQELRRHDTHSGIVRADMRRLPFQTCFDAVLMLFTSFGYFDDEENEQLLREIHGVVKPGGRLLLDLINPVHLKQTLVPESVDQLGDWELQSRRWWRDGRVEKSVLWKRGEEKREYFESVRVYTWEELQTIFAATGWVSKSKWGGYDASPVSEESPRMLVLCETM